MKTIKSLCAVVLFSLVITSGLAQNKNDSSIFGVFVGTSPCGALIRPLLRVPAKGKCDLVKWELTLYKDPKTSTPTSYTIKSEYEFYMTNSTSEKKPLAIVEGTWTIQKDLAAYPGAVFYTLDPGNAETTLSFVQLDDNIIHIANADKSLMIGDGGQSYSLNRKDPRSGASVKQTFPLSVVDRSVSQIVFQGRTPCQEIARASAIAATEDCFKLKWLLTLNYNTATYEPSAFSLARTGHRESPITGTWRILHGTKANPQAIVYKLDTDKPQESLYLLQADKNVLFFMDKEMNLLVGNQDFDYTLNFKTSLFNTPKSISKVDAERILGEEAKLVNSTSEEHDGYEKYKNAYEATDPDTTVIRHLDYIFEKYKDTASAQKIFSDIVTSNGRLAGQEKVVMGDEAWLHSDGKNFSILMVRKDNKLVRMKVNKLTSKTSVKALKEIMKTLVSTL